MSLDLGTLIGRVSLEAVEFDRTYVRVVRQMANLGVEAERSTAGTGALDKGLGDVAAAGNAAATGLGRADKAMAETGLSASEVAATTRVAAAAVNASADATTRAGLASSRLTQAQLRQAAAAERLTRLQATESATTGRLASAQASLIAANDRVVLSQERVASTARLTGRVASAWAAIPGPVKTGAAVLLAAGGFAVKAATDYQKLTVNLVTGAGETERNLRSVSSGILSMAGQVGDSADALAKAMFTVESAGFHGTAALTLLRTAAEGAKVDNADLTVVVDALTSAMNAYHEPAKNAAQVTNTLIASAAVGKMHLQDLAASLGTVLPSAAALRVPLDQVGAAMATMTMQGTNADRAATYLRFAFAALANPTSKAQAAMKAVGLTSQQVADTMTHGGLPAVFTTLQTAVGKKFPAGSAAYLAALANMVGGTRGLQAVLELTGRNLTTMQGNLDSVQGRVRAAGNSVSDWAQVQKNVNVQWSKFIDGLGAAGIRIGTALIPAATALLRVLNGLGHDVSVVTGFFEHNRTAASALAVVLAMSLEPALARVAIAAAQMVKALVLGRLGAIGAGLKGVGLSGLVAKAGIAAAAIEALNAASDLRNLNGSVNALRASMSKPLTGNILADLNKEQKTLFASMSGNVVASMSHWQAFSTGLLHPVHAIQLLSGAGDSAIGHMSTQVAAAQVQVYALTRAMSGLPVALPEQLAKVELALSGMGITAQQLATTSVPALVAKTNAWIAANKAAQAPAAQARQDIIALGSGALTAADEVTALTSALGLMAGNSLSADQAAIAFRNDIAALDKALKHSHGSLKLNTQAGRDARDAFDTAAQQAITYAESEAKLKGGADRARSALADQIATLKAHAGSSDYAKHAIARLQQALDKLPQSVSTATRALKGQAADAKVAGQATGADYTAGVAVGLLSKLDRLQAAADRVALTVDTTVRHRHKSRSPSLLAMKTAGDYVAGLTVGIHHGVAGVHKAARLLAEAFGDGFAGAWARIGATLTATVHGSAQRLTTIVTQAVQDAQSTLGRATSTLTADRGARSQAAASYMSTALGTVDLSGAVVNGRVGNLAAYLRHGTRPLGIEHRDLALLRKRGLNADLLAQIAGQDPRNAIALATSILSGRSGSIHHLDVLDEHARALARATGRSVAGAQYDRRIAGDRLAQAAALTELRQLNHNLNEVKAILKKSPHDVGAAVSAAFDGAHLRSTARVGR